MKLTFKFIRLADLVPGSVVRHDKSDRPAIIIERPAAMPKSGIPAQSLDEAGSPMGTPFIIYATGVSEIIAHADAQRAKEDV